MFIKSESNSKPELLEKTDDLVFVRRNIIEVEKTDETNGNTVTVYQYEEAQFNIDEYETYKEIAKNSSLIDYIAMEAGVDLPESEEM